MIKQLQMKNKDFTIYDIHDTRFSEFGRVLSPDSYQEIFAYLDKHTSIPNQGNAYTAHDERFANLFKDKELSAIINEDKLEYGYVCGHNQKLNALEYHKSAEVNIALTPLILMLGLPKHMKNQSFHSKDVAVFFVPAGSVIELYPEILHFSPCEVSSSGFKCGVVLPYATNMDFAEKKQKVGSNEDLLFKTNKWLLCHKEFERFVKLGAHIGLIGKNYKMKY